jgi:hypothetical protein
MGNSTDAGSRWYATFTPKSAIARIWVPALAAGLQSLPPTPGVTPLLAGRCRLILGPAHEVPAVLLPRQTRKAPERIKDRLSLPQKLS